MRKMYPTVWSHRALAALLGAILKLPPIKQVLASQQVKSKYLDTLCRWWEEKHPSSWK